MALKKARTNGSGGKSHSRWLTREEVKTSIKKVRRVEDAEEEVQLTEEGTDIVVENHDSVLLLRPISTAGKNWLDNKIQDPQYLGSAVVVEPRFLENVVYGIQGDGLEIEFKS